MNASCLATWLQRLTQTTGSVGARIYNKTIKISREVIPKVKVGGREENGIGEGYAQSFTNL